MRSFVSRWNVTLLIIQLMKTSVLHSLGLTSALTEMCLCLDMARLPFSYCIYPQSSFKCCDVRPCFFREVSDLTALFKHSYAVDKSLCQVEKLVVKETLSSMEGLVLVLK